MEEGKETEEKNMKKREKTNNKKMAFEVMGEKGGNKNL